VPTVIFMHHPPVPTGHPVLDGMGLQDPDALATVLAAVLRAWSEHATPEGGSALLTAAWLIAWGEAFLTGALTAIFVAFRPQWLLTYSDARYLPPPVR